MKCFHHVDADGHCAGYWVAKRYPNMKPEDFIRINYGMDIDWFNMFEKDEPIIIVDFSFEPDDMKKILTKTKNVVWVDHHKTAIEKYKDFETEIAGLRYDGIAGCMLTWAYFGVMNDGRKPFNPSMCNEAPWMTKYIADYDVWKFEFGDETKHFKLGLDAEGIPYPCDGMWNDLLDIGIVKKLIEEGEVCEKYRNSLAELVCNEAGFEYELGGYKLFCMNTADAITNSDWFGDRIKKYDAVCSFGYNKDKTWTYSFYSEKIDVAKLAQSIPNTLSAGGHMKAAGAQSKEFIFSNQKAIGEHANGKYSKSVKVKEGGILFPQKVSAEQLDF